MNYTPTRRWSLRRHTLIALTIGGLLLWGFDHMMRADKANLCASEETAYQGCR